MATLPSVASLTGATTTNAQQKTNFSDLRTFIADLLGTDSANKTAARAALGALGVTDFPSSLAASGYMKIPTAVNVVIVQWGSFNVTAVSGGYSAFSYPIRFPNACFQVVGGRDALGSNAVMLVGKASGDPAGGLVFQNFGASAETGKFIAIGY